MFRIRSFSLRMAAKSRRSACTGTMMVLAFLSFILISIADAKPQYMYSAHPTQHQHHDNKQRAVIRNVRQNSPYQQLQPIAAYAAPVTHNRQYRDDVQQATQVTYENTPIIQANNDQYAFGEQQQQPYVAADVSIAAVDKVDPVVASLEVTALKKKTDDKDETFYTCCIPIGQCIFRRPKEPAGKPDEKCQCWNCQGPPPFWPPFQGPPIGPGCDCPLEYPPPIWNAKGKKGHCNWMNDCNNFDCGGNFWDYGFMPNWCNVECGNKTAPVGKPDGKPCSSCHNFGWGCPNGCDDNWEMGIGFICQKCKAKDCFKPPQHNFGCNPHHGHGPHNNNPCVFDMMYDCPYY